jgi:hypothetical protein
MTGGAARRETAGRDDRSPKFTLKSTAHRVQVVNFINFAVARHCLEIVTALATSGPE